jgi:hypothetical protein
MIPEISSSRILYLPLQINPYLLEDPKGSRIYSPSALHRSRWSTTNVRCCSQLIALGKAMLRLERGRQFRRTWSIFHCRQLHCRLLSEEARDHARRYWVSDRMRKVAEDNHQKIFAHHCRVGRSGVAYCRLIWIPRSWNGALYRPWSWIPCGSAVGSGPASLFGPIEFSSLFQRIARWIQIPQLRVVTPDLFRVCSYVHQEIAPAHIFRNG